jgi:tetratricopeptide (TPR) repeat protein
MFGLVALVVYIIVPPPPSRGVRKNQATGDLRAARESQATRDSSQSKLSKLEEQLGQAEIEDPHLIYVQDIDRRGGLRRKAGEPVKSSMTASYIDSNTASLIKDIEELTEEGLVASHAETYYRMGIYNQSLTNYDKAIKFYENAIGLRPRWSKPIIGKALCLEALGNWDGALAAYRESDTLFPDRRRYASVLENLAATFMVTEQYQKAAIDLERVTELYLHDTGKVPLHLFRMSADAYRHLGNKSKEKSALEKMVQVMSELSGSQEELNAVKRRLDELK